MAVPRVSRLFAVLSAIAFFGCSQMDPAAAEGPAPAAASGKSAQAACTPLETRDPNASGQQPSFAGQTRACGVTSNVPFAVTVVARGLDHPWAVEPLPDGALLVSERPGMMRVIGRDGKVGAPIAGVPKVDAVGQGGLLDVALSPSFASDHTVYWSFSEPRDGGNATSVARGVLSSDRTRLTDVRVIFRAMPAFDGGAHFGSRLVFAPDGMLFVTLGERSDRRMRPQAQRLDSHMGKVVRIRPDGGAPPDNPFVGRDGALPEIWTLGHRNIQSAALDPDGRLWIVEHGTRGGDELNLIQKGKNYGWPVVAFGEEYSGSRIGDSVTRRAGFEDPVYYWDPVIAPSGMEFYTGSAFPAWKGSAFVGGLASTRLVRLVIENGRVTGEEHLLADRNQRIRDVRQGPDGALWVVTDERDGEVWRIAPR